MSHQPVIVIGLDGADLQYVNKFGDILKNIGELREEGIYTPLDSTHPPWTGSAWPSMYTGVDPSYHGVYDFFDYEDTYPSEAEVVTRNDVNAPAIWNYLTELNLKSIVLNVPVTHPTEELNGVLIPGYLASEDERGYPNGIREELSEALGYPYRIYSEHETSDESSKKIDGYEKLIKERAEAAAHLLKTVSWDFAMIQIQKTDAVFHNSSSSEDFKRIYKAADELIGQVIDACDSEPNIIICSDHGIGPVTGYTVYINQLLQNHGLVEATSKSSSNSLTEIKEGTDEQVTTKESNRITAGLITLIEKSSIDPSLAYHFAQKFGVENQLMRLIPNTLKRSVIKNVNWDRSKAFCRRASEQGIRINLEGRDPAGVVSKDEYEKVRDKIIEILTNLRTPDGNPVFEYVKRREELYEGPYSQNACDVLFRTENMNHTISTALGGAVLIPVNSYNHKSTGIFIASGSNINASWDEKPLSLVDVAPLIFALLNKPIPAQMTGSVPNGLVTNSTTYNTYENVTYSRDPSYSQEQEEVTDRLRDLGYL